LVEFDQLRIVCLCAAARAGVLGGDTHQAHGLALQRGFDLLTQVWLRLVEAHAHFQPRVALGFGEQVDVGQLTELLEDIGQGRGVQALQVDGAGDQDRFAAHQPFALERHVENLVLVADFGEGQGYRRAAVANALLAIDLLRLVQMAEGHIRHASVEQCGGQRLGITDDQAAFGVFGHRPTGHVRMADGYQCLAFVALGIGGCDQPFMHLADAAQVIIA